MAGERVVITLGCTVCKDRNYYFARGKKKEKKLEIKKFCPKCGKRTPHKETK
ncbi:MAG: 50S ribosomal protein L33 [Endomicrobiales bacterium]|nr:50S ribosomal protein L33 [Endomicrobiales bacterium]